MGAKLEYGDLIDIMYRLWRDDGANGVIGERWIRAEVIDCETGTWPLARLADGQLTEIRPFMPWRIVVKGCSESGSRPLAA